VDADELEKLKKQYLLNVPKEFRRVELFISGTIPTKFTLPESENLDSDVAKPSPTATPFTTWQESEEGQKKSESEEKKNSKTREFTTIMYCPTTKLRATAYCPDKEAKTYPKGDEPKDFCPVHTKPQN